MFFFTFTHLNELNIHIQWSILNITLAFAPLAPSAPPPQPPSDQRMYGTNMNASPTNGIKVTKFIHITPTETG